MSSHFSTGLVVGLALLTLVVTTAIAKPPPGGETGLPPGFADLDRVRAIVDDEVITQFELERAFAPLSGLGHAILDDSEREKWFKDKRKEVLAELVNTQLILSEARKMDHDVQPQRVAEHMQKLRAEMKLADDAALEAFVKQQGFRNGEHYQQHVEEEMLKTDTIRYKIARRVRPSRDEIKRVFLRDYHGGKGADQIRAQHILIRVPQLVTATQIREISVRANKVRDLALAEQKTFEELAKEHSDDKNASMGGELGWFGRCVLEAEFEREAFKLEPGRISKLVRTRHGYHIVRVLERRVVPIEEPADVKRCIKRDLEFENAGKAYDALTKELRVLHHVREL